MDVSPYETEDRSGLRQGMTSAYQWDTGPLLARHFWLSVTYLQDKKCLIEERFPFLRGRLDKTDKLFPPVTVLAGEFYELVDLALQRSSFRCPGDGYTPAPSELEGALVTEDPDRPQDGVLVDPQDGGQVLRQGSRSPGAASPSALARRISPATCSKRGSGLPGRSCNQAWCLLD